MDFRLQDYLSAPYSLWRQYRWMQKTPYFSEHEMGSIILDRLRGICIFAQETIPYYQDLFSRIGFKAKSIDSFEEWAKLPVLDKNTVRLHLDRLQSTKSSDLGAVWCETSGSTGTAMRFLLDRKVNIATFALFWRTWNMAPNWHIGKRQATLSGYADNVYEYRRLTRILALSSFHLSEKTTKTFYNLLQEYEPVFLRGYPSALYLFAKLLDHSNIRITFPMLFSGAETMLPFQREFIESFFDGKVIDHYTHWERLASICECIYGNLHAQNDYGYHEILHSDGTPCKPGELGRLVCTSLYNHAMPLIRYDTRDFAVWSAKSACPCGSRFPIIERIDGRIEDVVLTPDGRLVGRLDAAFKFSPDVLLAQILQYSQSHILVNIVVDKNYNQDQEQMLLSELRKRLGEQIDIEIKHVKEDSIIRSNVGKIRFVISYVPCEQKYGHS